MKLPAAIVLAGLAIAGAVLLATVHLKAHGHFVCDKSLFGPDLGVCDSKASYWEAGRAVWQIPLAILVAALGIAAAVFVARTPRSGVGVASGETT